MEQIQTEKTHVHDYTLEAVYDASDTPKGNIVIVVFHCEDRDCPDPWVFDYGTEIKQAGV